MRRFETALKEALASVVPEMEREYEELRESLKQDRPSGQRRICFTVPTNLAAD